MPRIAKHDEYSSFSKCESPIAPEYMNYGQVARKSCCPKSCCPKPKSCCPKFFVMSPENHGHVARNLRKKILKNANGLKNQVRVKCETEVLSFDITEIVILNLYVEPFMVAKQDCDIAVNSDSHKYKRIYC